MTVEVHYGGKKYFYLEVDFITTWVDEHHIPVPVKLHSILREKALASGTDPSIFICNNIKIPIRKSKVDKTKNNQNNMQGVVNPFK